MIETLAILLITLVGVHMNYSSETMKNCYNTDNMAEKSNSCNNVT